jgi:gamma-glutamylcysteine synthetase
VVTARALSRGNDQLYGNAGDDLMVDHRTTQVMVDYTSIRALMSRLKVTVKLDKTWTWIIIMMIIT